MTRQFLAATAVACMCGLSAAHAKISDGIVRVGVLNDANGIFQDTNGPGSVEAAKMAAEDFAGGGKNIKVEIVSADHQNKPDVGSAIVRRWIDVDKVDAIVDVPNSAVGLAANALIRGSRMTFLASSTASSDLTGKDCSPNTVQWVTDTWSIAHSTTAAILQRGGDSWYFSHRELRTGGRRSKRIRPRSLRQAAARFWAPRNMRLAMRIIHHSCCRRRLQKQRSSVLPTRGRTRSTS